MIKNALKTAQTWLTEPFDTDTQNKVKRLIDAHDENLIESFYKNMAFGTGGMRGIMGVGTNRINKYTLGRATQGLSNYIKQRFPNKELSVAINYDCRHNSTEFSQLVADVFSANNISVYLFEEMRPTPELSFAVRYLNCDAGIVLTASHNPPEYNGYKVYWNDGGQIVPPEDNEIIAEVNKVAFDAINFNGKADLIQKVGKALDAAFLKESVAQSIFNKKGFADLNIVYTSLHGTSIKLIPDALAQAGFTKVNIVPEQAEPDGDFPTVTSPNPEEPAALKMAIDLGKKIGADIVFGTDPDSDRLGIATPDLEGNIKLLNGNQTMVLMVHYLLKQWQKQGKLNGNQFVGSTIVSTSLIDRICDSFKVETKVGLTGFKWIAKMIRDSDSMDFIGGGEESFGFMVGDFVRDKDAVSAALLACQIASEAKTKGSSLYKELLTIYTQYGFYKEHLIAIVKKGIDGAEIIEKMMIDLRKHPLKTIDNSPVTELYDYQSGICVNFITGEKKAINIPKSNVLIYHTADGSTIAARPSGTEPKIKFYFSVNKTLETIENAAEMEVQLDAKIQRIIKDMNL
ncbi:MAG: phospho-sugar mutase [Flavobacteriaceae bacterium]|nr:phospho-sugar mutase [Flavobacteriaceae bacterium]